MSQSCSFDGCTFEETGLCALSQDPSLCSNRTKNATVSYMPDGAEKEDELDSLTSDYLGAPVLVQPESKSALVSSRSLEVSALNSMMSSRYVHVVGILGEPESGKTACLASLYLLVSHAALEGWSFADSRSLAAFEEIVRGARNWNEGNTPEQMTTHTELADDLQPGFLHMRLKRSSDGRTVDLALPDIPGEWTQALVTNARSERLEFMKSAETIWIVLDGRALSDPERCHGLIARVGQLVGRLNTMLEGHIPRLLIVITHHDHCCLEKIKEDKIRKEVLRRGKNIILDIVSVAPFSDRPDEIPAGFGISKLLHMTVNGDVKRPIFWRSTEPVEGGRYYLGYRRTQ